MFKSYSSKAAALKGAKRNNIHPSLVIEVDGKWGFQMMEEVQANEVPSASAALAVLESLPNDEGQRDAAIAALTPKRTIEKDREERNGVKRPSAGGMCRAVWDWCDAHVVDSTIPAAKQVKEAAAQYAWNANNASIEYYNWRKFMGVRARSTTLPE